MRKKRKGFTLLEVFVVTVIIAVLAAIVWVNYSGFIKRQNVRAAAEEIVAELRLAQANAVKEELYYAAFFTPDDMTVKSGTDYNGGGGQVFKTIYFKEPISISFSNGASKVILNPNGTINIAVFGDKKFIAEKKCFNAGIIGKVYAESKPPEMPGATPTVNQVIVMTLSIGNHSAYIDIQQGGKISVRY